MAEFLLTGATGYIGSKLAQALDAQGHRLHLILREHSPLQRLEGILNRVTLHTYRGQYHDIAAVFDAHPVDAVFHLATHFVGAHRTEDIAGLMQSNLQLGTHLLEAMRAAGCESFINTGTYWQYDEKGNVKPNSLYAATKQAFCDIVDYYAASGDLNAMTLILYDVYGKGDTRGKIFTLLDKAAKDGAPLGMTQGEQQLRLTHVDDAVAAFLQAQTLIDAPQYKGRHVKYFAAAQPVALREVVQTYLAVTGKTITVQWGAVPYRAGQIMTPYYGEPLPAWQARTDLAEGIRRLFL